jgi:hypothetical protein
MNNRSVCFSVWLFSLFVLSIRKLRRDLEEEVDQSLGRQKALGRLGLTKFFSLSQKTQNPPEHTLGGESQISLGD